MALTKVSLVAKKALEAYLMVSAVVGSVTISGAPVAANSSPTAAAAALVVGPDHDAVGMEAVGDRRALAEELGVGHDRDVVAADDPLDEAGRADRHRRLVHHDGPVGQVRGDLLGRRLDVGEVGRAVVALGRGDAEEDELGARDRLGAPGTEAQAARSTPSAHQLLEARPRRWATRPRSSAAKRAGSRSAQHHPVAEVGQDRGRRQADVAGADHRHPAARRAPGASARSSRGRRPGAGVSSTATRRPSASCQSGRSGSPPRRSAALSSTELAGRGAGRGGSSVGGGDRLDPARVAAGGLEDGPDEPEPGGRPLVRDVEDPGAPVEGQGDDGRPPGRR